MTGIQLVSIFNASCFSLVQLDFSSAKKYVVRNKTESSALASGVRLPKPRRASSHMLWYMCTEPSLWEDKSESLLILENETIGLG